MPTELSPVDILIKVKKTLSLRGWFQGNLVEPNTESKGRVCFIGAMNVAMRDNPYEARSIYKCNEGVVMDTIIRLIKEDTGQASTVLWNDNPCRTIVQVNKLIDQAIKNLKGIK